MKVSSITVPVKNALQQTLFTMNELERYAINYVPFQQFVFKNFSSECDPCIPGKIWNYVKNNFTFKYDAPFDELLIAPYILINTKHGDCDDFSLFIKTCLDLIGGWFTNYILFAKDKNRFTHIAVFAHRGIIGNQYRDGIIIDGASENFNLFPYNYKYYKMVQ